MTENDRKQQHNERPEQVQRQGQAQKYKHRPEIERISR